VAAAAEARQPPIDRSEVGTFTIPTDFLEADGTPSWGSTTIVVVHAHASGVTGLGYTYADVSTVDYAAWAELIGLKDIKVTQSSEIDEAWWAAPSADRPVIISALTDPNEAPLPPHITFQQAEGFAKSIEKDTTSGMAGAIESLREKAQEFLPGQ
jgi:hypothetical protein